jgi:hypothetical protein
MSIFDLEILKEKPIKSKGIMPHLKISKNMLLDKRFEKKNKKCSSYGLMKILTIQKSLTIKQLRF